MDYNQNLKALRNSIRDLKVDVLFLGMHNAFGNYNNSLSDIQFFSGFSGSNGRAVISQEKAILAVDGRYIKQAKEQTDERLWSIESYPKTNTSKLIEQLIHPGQVLGLCVYSLSYRSYLVVLELSKRLDFSIKLILDFPVITRTLSTTKVSILSEKDMGESIHSRIKKIQNKLANDEVLLITDSSMIGWISSLRLIKTTTEKNIIPIAVLLITKNNKPILLFDLRIDNENNDFEVKLISEFKTIIAQQSFKIAKLNFATTPLYFPYLLQSMDFTVIDDSISCQHLYSIKNDTEITHQKHGAILTSLAMIEVLAATEQGLISSELEAVEMFYKALAKHNTFVDFSFNPISAFGSNSAIIHYNPQVFSNCVKINNQGLFLFDGGAHFKSSTTDMTRTIYIGNNPDFDLKTQYTVVLKSIINFSLLQFPKNTKAYSVDSIARAQLWQYGFDYAFGTGHGVGIFGNVHEYPGISPNSTDTICENMVITIEPGIYTDHYGIRMENMLLTKYSNSHNYIKFETINFIPFAKSLIRSEMLSGYEIKWLNNYNQQVLDKCLNYFKNSDITLKWLLYNTSTI